MPNTIGLGVVEDKNNPGTGESHVDSKEDSKHSKRERLKAGQAEPVRFRPLNSRRAVQIKHSDLVDAWEMPRNF
jgi:hypothetical protein